MTMHHSSQHHQTDDLQQFDEMPIHQHLILFRKVLIKIVAVVLGLFLSLLPFANHTYQWLSEPLRQQLPANSSMIATDVTATFLAPFKLNLCVALMISMPFILYQIWSYIKPALHQHEKNMTWPLLASSISLFYFGIAFAYFVVLPSILHFFMSVAPESVAPMTDINSYLTFCLKLFFVFGLTFEIPIITILLILSGLVTTQALINKRRFVIVGCFFVAMFATPPDALSMIMLAIPMWMLFEIGLLFGRTLEKRNENHV